MVWARMQSQWEGKNYCFSFPKEVEESYSHNAFSDVIFYPRVLQSGIENYLSACMSCFSDDLALLLLCLDLFKSGIREYISPRINFYLYSTLAEKWVGQH